MIRYLIPAILGIFFLTCPIFSLVNSAHGLSKDCIIARKMAIRALDIFKNDKRRGLAGLIKAYKFCPDDEIIQYNLGNAYYSFGARRKAIALWKGLKDNSEWGAKAVANSVWAMLEEGLLEDALKLAKEGLDRYPNESSIKRALIQCYVFKHQYKKAYEVAVKGGVDTRLKEKCAKYLVDAGWRKFRSGLEKEAMRDMVRLTKEFPGERAFFVAQNKMLDVMLGNSDDVPLPEPEPISPTFVAHNGGASAGSDLGETELLDPILRNLPEERPSGDSYALIIGIGDYKYIKDLRYASRDAQNVYRLLTKKGFVQNTDSHVHLRLDGEVTLTEFRKELKWLERRGRLNPKARIFFYFSGHGAPLIQGDTVEGGLLLPSDAVLEDLEGTGIRVSDVKSMLASLKNKEVVAMVDACFTGQGRSISLTKPAMLRIHNEFLQSSKPFIVSAVKRPAQEFPEGRQGAFTYFFLKGLLGEADGLTKKDGWVDAKEAFQYAKSMLRELDIDQDPMMSPDVPVKLVRVR